MSVSHDRLLLLKTETVDKSLGFDDVCRDKHVNVAYNNEKAFMVSDDTGDMVEVTVFIIHATSLMLKQMGAQICFLLL